MPSTQGQQIILWTGHREGEVDREKWSTSIHTLKYLKAKCSWKGESKEATRVTEKIVSKWVLRRISVLACPSLYYLDLSSDTIKTEGKKKSYMCITKQSRLECAKENTRSHTGMFVLKYNNLNLASF